MPATMNRHVVLSAPVACIAAALIATSYGGDASGAGATPSRGSTVPVDERFGIFRGAERASADPDERPKITRAVAASAGVGGHGVDVRLARQEARHKVHLASGGDEICLAVREADGSGSLGCAPSTSDDGIRPMTSVSSLGKDTWRVTALLIDGIDQVEITMADGRIRDAKVDDNIVDVVLSEPFERMTWTAPDGSAGLLKAAPPE